MIAIILLAAAAVFLAAKPSKAIPRDVVPITAAAPQALQPVLEQPLHSSPITQMAAPAALPKAVQIAQKAAAAAKVASKVVAGVKAASAAKTATTAATVAKAAGAGTLKAAGGAGLATIGAVASTVVLPLAIIAAGIRMVRPGDKYAAGGAGAAQMRKEATEKMIRENIALGVANVRTFGKAAGAGGNLTVANR